MSATAATFGGELDALGIWWPRGDGDALRVTAADWTAMADLLDEIGQVLDAVVTSVAAHHAGDAANRFTDLWARWSGPAGFLPVTAADCRRLAAALDGFGTDVDVADRALLAAAEQALDELLRALTPADVTAWTDWLHEASGVVRDDLAARASVRADALATVGGAPDPRPPHEPVPVAVDPGRITWPSPGTPRDLSSIGTTPVDLGAGQGSLPLAGPAAPGGLRAEGAPSAAPSIDVTGPAAAGPTSAGSPVGSGTTVIVVGNRGSVTVTVGAPSVAVPAPVLPGVATPVAAPVPPDARPHRLPDPIGRGAPATPVELTPSTSTFERAGPTALPLVDRSWVPSPTAAVSPLAAPSGVDPVAAFDVPRAVPIIVHPPAVTAPAVPVAGVGAAAATVAAAAAKKSSSGFLPMMPMGGGGAGGDEGAEPRRRKYRLR